MRGSERREPTPLTDQQIRSLAQTLCGEEYNPNKANALLLLMDNIQRHADAGETSEVITASILTKEVAFSQLDMLMNTPTYRPYAFAEQGVSMLSSVLIANERSKSISPS